MLSKTGFSGKVVVARLLTGEDFHEAVNKLAKENNISSASVSFIGGLHTATINTMSYVKKRAEPEASEYEGPLETIGAGIISTDAKGNYADHFHVTCAKPNKEVVMGHLAKGIVTVTMEVVITEVKGMTLKRLPDEKEKRDLLFPL